MSSFWFLFIGPGNCLFLILVFLSLPVFPNSSSIFWSGGRRAPDELTGDQACAVPASWGSLAGVHFSCICVPCLTANKAVSQGVLSSRWAVDVTSFIVPSNVIPVSKPTILLHSPNLLELELGILMNMNCWVFFSNVCWGFSSPKKWTLHKITKYFNI